MKIGDRVFVRGYIDEIRKDTVIVRNDGGYFGTIPSEVMGELPSAQPERKKGKWIRHDEIKNVYGGIYIECSECGEKYVVQHILDEKYCRNCGADMRYGAEKARDAVGEVPAVDAVDVVRCRDCWCHKPGKYRFDICSQTEDDFYCARGERK